MKIRIGPYTIFENHHLAIKSIRDDDDHVLLRFEGHSPPSTNFEESKHEKDVYYLNLSISSLNQAYWVQTYCKFKGYTFEVFPLNIGVEGLVTISTKEIIAFEKLKLTEIKNGFYATDIHVSELEKLWEERRPSNYNLPMPKVIETIKEIKI